MPVRTLSASAVGIIFDLDNTLVASHIDFTGMRQAVWQELQAAGVPVTGDQAHWPIGRLVELTGHEVDLQRRIWELVSAFEVAGMEGAPLEAGAAEVTAALVQRGHPLAVLTNNSGASAYAALSAHALRERFVAVFCRDNVPSLKPAPEGVLAARVALGQPERLIVVGDSWIDGVAARDAGALFVAVGNQHPGSDKYPVWAHITTLHELLELNLTAGGVGQT